MNAEVAHAARGGLMLAWNRSHCRPPLPDAEVARVVHSIERLHAHGEAAADEEHP